MNKLMRSASPFIYTMLALAVSTPQAFADDSFPTIHGVVSSEVENDWAYRSDDSGAEVNTLYTTIEPTITIGLTDRLSIETGLVFEPVQATDAGEDTSFDNEGLYVEQLKMIFGTEKWSLFGGKFNPSFGSAWDLAPGVYGTDFAEDYEQTERLGLGGSYTLGNDAQGEYTLSANLFMADRTPLSDALFTKRERLHLSDGGINNTRWPSSFSVTMDGENTGGIANLGTHIGYYNQADGTKDSGLDRETAYTIGLDYAYPVTDRLEATFLGEWAGIRDSGGSSDDVDYYTAGTALILDSHWNLSLSHTSRTTSLSGGDDIHDKMTQISGGYAFDNGITVDAGYKTAREDGTDTDTLGVLVGYGFEF